MNGNYHQEKTTEKPPRRKFWQNLLIMDSGDLKKILSLSSLLLAFLLLAIYAAAFIFLMPIIEKIAGGGPLILANLAESIIPALAATGLIMLCWPLFKDKRVLPAAYLWLVFLALLILITVLIKLRDDPGAQKTFIYLFAWDVFPALLIGNFFVWRRYWKFIRM